MASFDVMPNVQLYQPAELDDALSLAGQLGEEGWLLGGGQDTYGWLKDRAKQPQAMIDLNGIESLRGIREIADGIVEVELTIPCPSFVGTRALYLVFL